MSRHWVNEAALRALREKRDRAVAALTYTTSDTIHDAKKHIAMIDRMITAVEELDG